MPFMICEDVSLKGFNTFGIDVKARSFVRISSEQELHDLISTGILNNEGNILVLGEGSNVLFARDYDGLVLKMDIRGIQVEEESGDRCLVRVQAGHNWDELVMFAVDSGLYGLENLSLIPGSAGAAPIQNIGAYGAELKSVLREVTAIDRESGQLVLIPANDCGFGYRTSIFKTSARGRYIITSILLDLTRTGVLNISYGALRQELQGMEGFPLTLKTIRSAIIRIRQSKLPDPSHLGNAGSFFKNPVVPSTVYHALKASFPGIVANAQPDGMYKLAAGWMIEHLGWKGFRMGDAGVHDRQALVLVNHGHASGTEILQLAERIRSSVQERFGVELENEVNVV